ncbi:MAG: hypothetical protein ACI9FB_003605 [Candidatus Azotimanducaceae bacterium]|jgi:hypothetical protein
MANNKIPEEDSSNINENINEQVDEKKAEHPAQIPLLEDVIYNTSLPFPAQPRRRKLDVIEDPSKVPRVTDLFGGTPETATAGPYSASYDAESIESARIKQQASQMIDTLVQEYSEEIVRRLRDELSSILDDLDLDNSRSTKK